MRKIVTYFLFVFITLLTYAQTPQSIKYQAIVRNSQGNVLPNQLVSFKISIIIGNANGQAVYVETHKVATNDYGLANLEIGLGTVLSGVFSDINWGGDLYFVKTEIDNVGGSNFKFMGTTQLMSVPYALYAERSSAADNDHDQDSTNEIQNLDLTGTTLSLTKGNSVQLGGVVDLDYDPTNEIQNISINGRIISLDRGGGTVNLPPDEDIDSTNEIQNISITGNQISLSNGGGTVLLPQNLDNDPSNELQNLNKQQSGNQVTIDISQGNSITFSTADNDNDSVNEIQSLSITNTGVTRTIDISQGNNIQFDVADDDNDSINEIQQLSISNDTLSLSKGGSVKLPKPPPPPEPIPQNGCILTDSPISPTGFIYSGERVEIDKSEMYEVQGDFTLPFWPKVVGTDTLLYALENSSSSYKGYEYVFSTGNFKAIADRNYNIYNYSAIGFDDKVYTIGGSTGGGNSVSYIEEYQPNTNSWTIKSNMPSPRHNTCACRLKDDIYVIGGFYRNNSSWNWSDKVEVYHPANDSWNVKAALPDELEYVACVEYNNEIFVFGGIRSTYRSVVVYKYDPIANSWSSYDNLRIANTPSGGDYNLKAYNLRGNIYIFNTREIVYNYGTTGMTTYSIINYIPETKSWRKVDLYRSLDFNRSLSSFQDKVYLFGANEQLILKFIPKQYKYIHCKQ
jgi:Kelch motif